jgi:hypothetical protein
MVSASGNPSLYPKFINMSPVGSSIGNPTRFIPVSAALFVLVISTAQINYVSFFARFLVSTSLMLIQVFRGVTFIFKGQ